MDNIAGRYGLTIVISKATYEFTGNDRNAQFVATYPNETVAANCTQIFGGSAQAVAIGECNFIIRRARIISSGAAGVRAPTGSRAAQVHLKLEKQLGGELDDVFLKFQNWNEWTEINATLRPYKNKPTWLDAEIVNHKPAFFVVDYNYSYYNVDDYNVQAAYVGQSFTPILELDVEAAGMLETSNFNIF